MKTKRRSVAFRAFCAFSVLSKKRSSLSLRREEESSRGDDSVHLLLLLLQLVLSLFTLGKSFFTKDDTTYAFSFAERVGCVCFGRFALLSRVFFFFCYFWLWAELCALFCSALFTRLLRTRFYHSFPLYFSPLFIQMRKHIKVFIIS